MIRLTSYLLMHWCPWVAKTGSLRAVVFTMDGERCPYCKAKK